MSAALKIVFDVEKWSWFDVMEPACFEWKNFYPLPEAKFVGGPSKKVDFKENQQTQHSITKGHLLLSLLQDGSPKFIMQHLLNILVDSLNVPEKRKEKLEARETFLRKSGAAPNQTHLITLCKACELFFTFSLNPKVGLFLTWPFFFSESLSSVGPEELIHGY